MPKIGLIQMTSGPDPQSNLADIKHQVRLLANQGTELVITPENSLVFGCRENYHQVAEPLGEGKIQSQLASLAKTEGVFLVVGSMPIRRAEGVTTTSLVYDPKGQLIAHYDKLHMFDVDVEDTHQHYRESETFTPGNQIVTVNTPIAHLGLTICYDVRFPHLYSELVQQGANVLLVPAAFTAVTGAAHWEPLLRSRAIETQSWVVAANQTGTHPCGRETWGHSMVVSPWGEVVASLSNLPGNLVAILDLDRVDVVRAAMPTLKHIRFQTQLNV
ncbi:carbon-nitrogen hydrolase family protein [Vibrio pectenicida]|uniref:Carbon-nitrogen hydrolase family protein n=1 Tax=Vibrio pectenicida TaxID=62763 RepID=A0A7Y4EF55_9VIBR|nr:carbon-nitrogen hydrolase family protein [Vibrio pectenicida]NOH72063.1 carbon-nitrogen hydrolase family protein [Vibrio pectenicida]